MTMTTTNTPSDEDHQLCAANQLGAPLDVYRIKSDVIHRLYLVCLFMFMMGIFLLILDFRTPVTSSVLRFGDSSCMFLGGVAFAALLPWRLSMRVIVCEHGLLQVSKMYMRTRVKAVRWQDMTGFSTGVHSSEISIHYRKDNRLFISSLTINSAYERLDDLAALLEEHRRQFMSVDWRQIVIEHHPAEDGKYRCPCCGYRTLNDRCEYELCAVCGWQDDGQDDWDATTNRPLSPNHMSLALARENYQRFGAIHKSALDSVRPPLPEEL